MPNRSLEEVFSGVWQYVWQASFSLDIILVYYKLARATISEVKSQFLMSELKLIAFIYDTNGRRLDPMKVNKIVKYSSCTNLTNVRTCIKLCIYY